ncbi:MAG TPA: hypothetical protein VK094_00410 [Pseudogracilibacillus sp.]|nr:hypothetical protein [Pseudogracilibacillus sp.]
MLYQKNGEWALSPYKVKYRQHGEECEKYTHDKKWWKDFAAKWDHTEILEFEDVTYSDEQKARLEEVKDVKEGFEYYAARYVLDGKFPNQLEPEERLEDHPLRVLQLEKENKQLGQVTTDLDIRILMQELK